MAKMRRTLMWTWELLFALLRLATSLASEHTIVFPRLLENRAANGQKTLVVNDHITLQLTPSSVFAEEFTVDTMEEGSPVKDYFRGEEYERNLYHDRHHKASVTVKTDNGIQVEGRNWKNIYALTPAIGSRTFIGWSMLLIWTLRSTKPGASTYT
uniref:Putative metalloprotease n=1 Tax=Ixodes ricinus TaxID=34613 RepID=A0A0K8RHI6_IXORI